MIWCKNIKEVFLFFATIINKFFEKLTLFLGFTDDIIFKSKFNKVHLHRIFLVLEGNLAFLKAMIISIHEKKRF